MPKYSKEERKARRRLFRINIPLSGLKTTKANYKRDLKGKTSARAVLNRMGLK